MKEDKLKPCPFCGGGANNVRLAAAVSLYDPVYAQMLGLRSYGLAIPERSGGYDKSLEQESAA